MPKSVVLVFLSPPCCTAMLCQPEVTGFVVLTLEAQILKPLTSSHAHTVFYLCSSHWLHFFHILVSPVWSECMRAMLFVQSDLLVLPLVPIGIVRPLPVELWSSRGLPLGHRQTPLFWCTFRLNGSRPERGNINSSFLAKFHGSCWNLNSEWCSF